MKKIYFAALIVFLSVSLACRLPFISGEDVENSMDGGSSLPQMDSETFIATVKDQALLDPVPLSAAQAQTLGVRGAPNRFILQFSEEMRQETWYYDRLGYEVTFRNGDVFTENKAAVSPRDAIFFSVYVPWQFNHEMGLRELLAISQSETFAYEPLEESLDAGLSIAYLKGLDIGFRGDQLLYIRTIPLGEGAREGSPGFVLEQPTPVQPTQQASEESEQWALTPEELAHQGTHTYHIQCNYSDGDSEDLYSDVTWDFTEEGLYIDGDGPFPPRNIDNFYMISDEGINMSFIIEADLVREDGSFLTEDDQGNPVEISFTCVYSPAEK